MLFSEQDGSDLVFEPGDVTFDAKPADLLRRLRRIFDNARTTLEEPGVTTLYLTFGALRWRDHLVGGSVSPLWMVPCEFESMGPDAPLRLSVADEEAQSIRRSSITFVSGTRCNSPTCRTNPIHSLSVSYFGP